MADSSESVDRILQPNGSSTTAVARIGTTWTSEPSPRQSGGPRSPDRLRQVTAAARTARSEQAAPDSSDEDGDARLSRSAAQADELSPERAGRPDGARRDAALRVLGEQSLAAAPSWRRRADSASEEDDEEQSPSLLEAQGEQLLRLRAVLELTRRSFLVDLMNAMVEEQREASVVRSQRYSRSHGQ